MRYSNDELAHFGVLGMKWGKHKTKQSNSSSTSKSLKDNSLIGIFDRQLARNRKRRK